MEQVTVKLTPTNPSNPTITRNVTNPQLILSDVEHDTYQLQITSSSYKPYSTQVVFNGDTTLNIHLEALVTQLIEWRPQVTITTIPITTNYVDDPTLNVGVEQLISEGTIGKTTKTWEAQYINGVSTGQIRNQNESTVPMVPRQMKRGTKAPPTTLTNILTQSSVSVTHSTNTYVNNVRTASDIVPIDKSEFEIRQWDNPSGALSVHDVALSPNSPYTIAIELENVGTAIDTAKFIIGLAFFGGKHIFNGSEVSIPPEVGEYNFKPHMPNSGKVTYLYQFTTEPNTPDGDYFQFNFDNAANNTKVRMSNLALYQGHVNPFGGA